MNTIMNLIDADESVIERRLIEGDVVEVMSLEVGNWMTVNEKLFRLEIIEKGASYKDLGVVNELYLKVQAN